MSQRGRRAYDGVSPTLMSEIAKRKGLYHSAKSTMGDLKKSYKDRGGKLRPGCESEIIEWALDEQRRTGKQPPRKGRSNSKQYHDQSVDTILMMLSKALGKCGFKATIILSI